MMIRIPFADPRPDDQPKTQLLLSRTTLSLCPRKPPEARTTTKLWSFLRPAVRRLFPFYAGRDSGQ
jgi:hypothetical protein